MHLFRRDGWGLWCEATRLMIEAEKTDGRRNAMHHADRGTLSPTVSKWDAVSGGVWLQSCGSELCRGHSGDESPSPRGLQPHSRSILMTHTHSPGWIMAAVPVRAPSLCLHLRVHHQTSIWAETGGWLHWRAQLSSFYEIEHVCGRARTHTHRWLWWHFSPWRVSMLKCLSVYKWWCRVHLVEGSVISQAGKM